MTATRAPRKRTPITVTTWQRNADYGVVKGPIRVVHPVLRRLRVFWEWEPRAGYYVVPLEDFDQVLAGLEADGVTVEMLVTPW